MLSSSMMVWLRSFEATARHANFTRAAAELCVSQGAVSQQVKSLETTLCRRLFVRTPRSLALTPDGERLYAVARDAFRALDVTLVQMRSTRDRQDVSLSCSPSFAMGWLTPRLGSFFRTHPEIHLKIRGDFHCLNRLQLHKEGLSSAVRYDLGVYEDLDSHTFLEEWLLPVASPEFLAAHPELSHPGQLRPEWLLHDSSPWAGADDFQEWEYWLQSIGVRIGDLPLGHTFNLSQLALAAAANGQGVAMGRAALVLEDLMSGRLVDIFSLSVRSAASYVFITATPTNETAHNVGAWLDVEADEFRKICARQLPHLK